MKLGEKGNVTELAVSPPARETTSSDPMGADTLSGATVCGIVASFVSGSGDGEVFVWKDYTDQKALEERRAEADLITKKQKISDAMYRESYSSAFRLALDLKYPAQLHKIIAQATKSEEDKAESFWCEVVESLSDEDLKECLRCASEWNTNSKLYLCGQMLLRNVFSRIHPDRLGSISGLEDVWNGLISYSDRHAKRIDTLVRSTYLLDYALSSGFMHKKDNNENNVTASD